MLQKTAQFIRTTDALPVLGVENNTLPFALLPHQLDSSISDHADFTSACYEGFKLYDEADCGWVLLARDDVRAFVRLEVLRRYTAAEAVAGVSSLPWRAGFVLGFLTGLAYDDFPLACFGRDYLQDRVRCQYHEELSRGHNPLVAIPALRCPRLRDV